MSCNVYLVETITNLHVGGNGDAFTIVDKSVQRDALTGFPTVFATSLKGALRTEAIRTNFDNRQVCEIFGSEVESENSSKGKYRFNDLHMLFFPVRSDHRPYYLATCPAMLRDAIRVCSFAGNTNIIELLEKLCALETGRLYSNLIQNEMIEAEDSIVESVSFPEEACNFFQCLTNETQLLMLSDKDMQETLRVLPIVSRNRLVNGISKALWYEEFVPRKSFFINLISADGSICDNFDTFICKNDCIQIGANATVGYGLCKFTKI